MAKIAEPGAARDPVTLLAGKIEVPDDIMNEDPKINEMFYGADDSKIKLYDCQII